MKRLGKFSGKIYSEEEIKTMQECGYAISDEQANDPEYIKELYSIVSSDCATCRGCPLYNET